MGLGLTTTLQRTAGGGGGAGSGVEITSAANFAALITAGGNDGDLMKDEATGLYYTYNATLGLPMPPDVQPTALSIDFDGSDVPAGATFGAAAWSSDGTEDASSDGSVLTITDDGASWKLFQASDADFLNTNNIGVIARVQISSENATATGFKCLLAIRPSNEKIGALCLAGGADGIGGAGQIFPFSTAAGGSLTGVPTYSADNSEYQLYCIFWNKTNKKYTMGVLGDPGCLYQLDTAAFATNYINSSSLAFGTYHGAAQCTPVCDYIKAFKF